MKRNYLLLLAMFFVASFWSLQAQGPTAVCQDYTLELSPMGSGVVTGPDIDGGSTAPAGFLAFNVSPNVFICSDVGTPQIVTLTITDINGDTDSCTATVTVVDNVAPDVVCQDFTIQLDSSGNASVLPAQINNGSSDVCGIASITLDQQDFTCADLGPNTVTLTVTDVNGNAASCTATVTVEDNIAPTAVCQDITVQLDGTGNVSIMPADVDGGSTDNCNIASYSLDVMDFTCADVGANTVTLTVTDDAGNSSTCTATVTVEDNEAPMAVCQDITVELDINGMVSITAADVDGGSTDNCGIASLAIDIMDFDCSSVGANTVTLTVTDDNGNVSTCTATVTVEDNIDPTGGCVADPTVDADPGVCTYTVQGTEFDATFVDNCISVTITNDYNGTSTLAGEVFPVGTTVVVWTGDDGNGQTGSCTTTYTVEDNEAPMAACQDFDLFLDAMGMGSITPGDIDAGSTDNCGVASLALDITDFTCADLGPNTVTLTVTDVNGNVSTCTATVNVIDTTVPVISCPMDVVASNDPGACGAVVVFADAIAIDPCGTVTVTQTDGLPSGSEFPVGVSTVEFTATDQDGNSASCTFTITVTDDEAPVAVCADQLVELDANGMATINAADVLDSASDNCGVDTVQFLVIGDPAGGCATDVPQDFGGENGTPVSISSVFNVAESGVLGSEYTLDNVSVDITHAWDGDVEIRLQSPAGSILDLSIANGGSGQNYTGTVFQDGGGDITGASAPFTGTFEPEGGTFAAAFDGEDINGDWTLLVDDNFPALDDGTLNEYCITFLPQAVGQASLDLGCDDVGVVEVTVEVLDEAGNSTTCTANITVEDNIAPEIVCIGQPASQSVLEDFEGASVPAGWSTEIVSGGWDWTFGSGAMPIGDPFPTNAAIFDDDAAGNTGENHVARLISPAYDMSGSASATLTFDYSLQDFAGFGFLLVEVWDGAAWQQVFLADDMDIPPTSSGPIDILPFANDAFQVRYTYDDEDGGWYWGAGVDNVLIEYDVPATPLEVDLDANGMATINASDLLLSVNEACGWTATVGGGGGDPLTLETTFAAGNNFNGNMFDVNVLNDVTFDSFDVNLDTGVSDDVEVWYKTGSFVGFEEDASAWTLLATASVTSAGANVPTPLDLDLGLSVSAGETVAFYVTTTLGGTMFYTNGTAVGNVFASDDNIEFLEGNGGGYPFAVTFSPRVWNGNIHYTAGAGISETIDFTCEDLGENQIEVTVTDDSGNVSTCIATVNVNDVTDPILVCQDVTIELDENGTAEIDPEALLATLPGTFEVITISSDNQSGAVGNTDLTVDVTEAADISFDWEYSTDDGPGFDGFGYLLNGVFTELTDPAGANNQSGSAGPISVAPGDVFGFRSSSLDGLFGASTTVVSNFMPGFDGQFDPDNWTLTLDNSDGDAFFVEIPGGPLSFDACGITVLAVDVTDVFCSDIGTPITATVFASDASGNIAACTSVITVVDAMGPMITCPEDQTVDPGEDNLFYEVPDYWGEGLATATDNCTDPVTITSQSPAAGELIPDGVYNVVLTAEDEYGNVSTCTFELTVESVLGISDSALDQAVAMYPNPAENQVTIHNSSSIALNVANIYDVNGKLVNTVDLSQMATEKTIDVSQLASGVYMVHIIGEEASAIKRLLKE